MIAVNFLKFSFHDTGFKQNFVEKLYIRIMYVIEHFCRLGWDNKIEVTWDDYGHKNW